MAFFALSQRKNEMPSEKKTKKNYSIAFWGVPGLAIVGASLIVWFHLVAMQRSAIVIMCRLSSVCRLSVCM